MNFESTSNKNLKVSSLPRNGLEILHVIKCNINVAFNQSVAGLSAGPGPPTSQCITLLVIVTFKTEKFIVYLYALYKLSSN